MSATFAECGGIVVDGDVIAREVVEPGTEGLAKLVDAFGEHILLPDGALNRPALAAVAFSDDDEARNPERHRASAGGAPALGTDRAAAEDAVIVEDIPLLVESQMAPMFPLVVIVHADEDLRVKRLIEYRGFSEAGCAGADRRPGRRGTAPQGRGCVAGQLGQCRCAEGARPRTVVPAHPAVRAQPADPGTCARRAATGAVRSVLARAGAADRCPVEHRVRAPSHPHRPHRVDSGARLGRQRRHRHSGDGRLAGHRRRTCRSAADRGLSAGRGDHW